jgi:hypothetical protein
MNQYSKIDHEKLFWAKVDKTDTCWNWTGYRDRRNYGQVRINSKGLYAHRASWQFANGPVPDGKLIDHMCHNPSCVRPDHLRVVNDKENNENRRQTSNSSSGFRGVYWNKRRGDWEAKVCHNWKSIHVGFFSDLEDAKRAVISKRLELFTHNDEDHNLQKIAENMEPAK